jgi:hypothetical protein
VKVSKRLVAALVILAAVFVVLRLGSDRGPKDEPLFPEFRAELAAKITIHGREVNTVLERENDTWIVASEDSFPAEPGAVENMFEKILTFSHKDRISSNPEKQALYQVDSTGIEVSIEGAGGTAIASFVIGKVGPDYQSTYVKDGTSNNVILAPSYLPPVFERGTRTWQDLTLYKFEPQEIVEIRITRSGETVALERDQAAAWYISQPESAACDNNEVSRLVRLLSHLRADYVAGRAPVEDSGVDAPDSSLWFRTAGGAEEEVVFGNRDENKRTYLKLAASDLIYLMGTHRVASLVAGYARLREKETDS